LLHAKGVDMVDIKTYLGHSAIQTTEKYTHVANKQKETTSQVLENVFSFIAG
jgi:site-specific recombinase XerD